MAKLILASTSPYRKELLTKLGFPFTAEKPTVDEEKLKDPHMTPHQLAEFLAFKKAESLTGNDRIVIGGDQLVHLDDEILGKPHNFENAFKQLKKMSGKTHELVTAVCVLHGSKKHSLVNVARMTFRNLSDQEITDYLNQEKPYDCAGSYKIESAGIRLLAKVECSDWTAIQGLPLIELHQILVTIRNPQ